MVLSNNSPELAGAHSHLTPEFLHVHRGNRMLDNTLATLYHDLVERFLVISVSPIKKTNHAHNKLDCFTTLAIPDLDRGIEHGVQHLGRESKISAARNMKRGAT